MFYQLHQRACDLDLTTTNMARSVTPCLPGLAGRKTMLPEAHMLSRRCSLGAPRPPIPSKTCAARVIARCSPKLPKKRVSLSASSFYQSVPRAASLILQPISNCSTAQHKAMKPADVLSTKASEKADMLSLTLTPTPDSTFSQSQ